MSMHMLPRTMLAALLASGLVAHAASPAGAAVVGGGGSSRVDCLTTFDAAVNTPLTKPRNLRCADGDPACDLDGIVNGVCNFQVAVCVNSSFDPTACSLNGVRLVTVEHAADNGDAKFDPEFQALQTRIDSDIAPYPNTDADTCTTATNFFVAIKGPLKDNKCKRNKKTIRLVTESTVAAGQGAVLVDKHKIDLTCVRLSVAVIPRRCSPAPTIACSDRSSLRAARSVGAMIPTRSRTRGTCCSKRAPSPAI